MLPIILGAVVPLLVKVAEKTFVGEKKGAEKKQWVVDFVDELFNQPWIPKFLLPARDQLESLVSEAIEAALVKLGWKKSS